MSARDIINKPSSGWLPRLDWTTLQRRIHMYTRATWDWGKMTTSFGTTMGWWIVTTAIITALPLVMEFNREFQVEEIERLTISDAIDNQGMTPLQLKQAGLTSAVNPEVLK